MHIDTFFKIKIKKYISMRIKAVEKKQKAFFFHKKKISKFKKKS